MGIEAKYWDKENKEFYRAWIVEQSKKILVISHGLGEHSNRYEHFANYMNENNFSVYALDYWGHGKSFGNRGHIESFSDYAEQLKRFIEFVKNKENVETVDLLGHSLGAVIVHDLIKDWTNALNKIILSNPGYKKKVPPTAIKVFLGNLVGKLFPKLSLNNELDVNGLSTDTMVKDKYVADPLVHDRVTANWFLTYTEKVDELANRDLSNVINPILFISSLTDPLTDQKYVEDFYHSLKCANSSMIHYDGMLHELLNEVDREKVYQDILTFLS